MHLLHRVLMHCKLMEKAYSSIFTMSDISTFPTVKESIATITQRGRQYIMFIADPMSTRHLPNMSSPRG